MELTVFTPTYNRGHLLHKLYESLRRQSRYDFEWLIIDDASSDDTESIVNTMVDECDSFPIRYYKQEKNGGKHRALNRAFSLAEGEYFFIVDSDDYLTDRAMESLHYWLNSIKGIPDIAGVGGARGKKKTTSSVGCLDLKAIL